MVSDKELQPRYIADDPRLAKPGIKSRPWMSFAYGCAWWWSRADAADSAACIREEVKERSLLAAISLAAAFVRWPGIETVISRGAASQP
jgi:hypothetical protein